MSKLTAAKRDKLPTADFAGPNRTYPDQDRGHAIAGKARAKQQEKRGALSPGVYESIVSRANKKLGR
jgi:hypothetical protein